MYHNILRINIYCTVTLQHQILLQNEKENENDWLNWFFNFFISMNNQVNVDNKLT